MIQFPRFFNVIAVALMLGLAACGGPTEPRTPTVDGSWRGTVGTQTLTLAVIQTGRVVTGNGTLSHSTGPLAITVSGTFSYPVFSATITAGTRIPFNITATLERDGQLIGTAQGSGATGERVALVRTP